MTTAGDPPGSGGGLAWRVEESGGQTTVAFVGEIDEHADFAPLRARLHGPVAFSLAGIRRINSCGVREWVNFVRDLPAVSELSFTGCSTAFVTQLNMIFNFRGKARIRSFFAPYACDGCGHDDDWLVEIGDDRRATLPTPRCPRCGEAMQFDDLPERYLSFLAES